MDGVKIDWKSRKIEEFPKLARNGKIRTKRNCASQSYKGFARRNREKHATFAETGEEDQHVICMDDVTSKELPWHDVRNAREQELKYMRDFGMYEKVDEREAIAQYQVTPVDTKWIDTNKALEGERM